MNLQMTITKQTFENIQDKSFEIAFGPEQLSVCELIEVKAINSQTLEHGQNEPFALLFQTSGDTIFEQNTYMVKNKELDEIPLFLVPVGADENGVRYEAVFT